MQANRPSLPPKNSSTVLPLFPNISPLKRRRRRPPLLRNFSASPPASRAQRSEMTKCDAERPGRLREVKQYLSQRWGFFAKTLISSTDKCALIKRSLSKAKNHGVNPLCASVSEPSLKYVRTFFFSRTVVIVHLLAHLH